MEVKMLTSQEFYPIMQEWWTGHGFPHVSPSMLPENTFVCYNDDSEPVYSVCFYNTDSHLCWLGWEISNPTIDKNKTKGCFEYLFKEVEKYARYTGYHIIFTTSNTPSVEGTLKNIKFETGDKLVNHYIKVL